MSSNLKAPPTAQACFSLVFECTGETDASLSFAGAILSPRLVRVTVTCCHKIRLDEESLVGIFKKLDVSNTNHITADDLRSALGAVFNDEHIKEIVDRADIDKVCHPSTYAAARG